MRAGSDGAAEATVIIDPASTPPTTTTAPRAPPTAYDGQIDLLITPR